MHIHASTALSCFLYMVKDCNFFFPLSSIRNLLVFFVFWGVCAFIVIIDFVYIIPINTSFKNCICDITHCSQKQTCTINHLWNSSDKEVDKCVLKTVKCAHTYFSHSFILPECIACQETYSVKHVLKDCTDLDLIRSCFYPVPGMKTLFHTVNVDRILTFIKEIYLFSKI